jgi:amidase
MLRFIENYDALLSPVMPYPALLHGAGFDDDKRIGFGYAQMHNAD